MSAARGEVNRERTPVLNVAKSHAATRLVLILSLVVVAAGCRTRVIHDPVEGALPAAAAQATTWEVDEAIWRAARKQGWVAERVEAGVLHAVWQKKRHSAAVRITHSGSHFQIDYEDSENLLREGDRIHRNYNSIVMRLADRIQLEPIVARPVPPDGS
jgi:hypothetical protein